MDHAMNLFRRHLARARAPLVARPDLHKLARKVPSCNTSACRMRAALFSRTRTRWPEPPPSRQVTGKTARIPPSSQRSVAVCPALTSSRPLRPTPDSKLKDRAKAEESPAALLAVANEPRLLPPSTVHSKNGTQSSGDR